MKTVEDKELLEMPIGVFDSGMGGLTVMREIMRQIPNEKIIYFGDTARVPYGSKSRETVTRYSRQIVRFLETQKVKAIVVACNTASAYALDELEKEIDIPIIGVVRPGAKTAAEVTRNGQVGVIATAGTIGSGIYPPAQTGCAGNGESVPAFCSACGRRTLAGSSNRRDSDAISERADRYGNRHADTWMYALSADTFHDRESYGRSCEAGQSCL